MDHVAHDSDFQFDEQEVLRLESDGERPNWFPFLEKLSDELTGEWIYRALEAKGQDENGLVHRIESNFDRESSYRWFDREKKERDKETPWEAIRIGFSDDRRNQVRKGS